MRTLQAILLSLAVHLLLVLIFQSLPHDIKPRSEAIEFEIARPVSQNEKKSKQMVRDAFLPEKLKVQSTEDKLKFLSDRVQRVKEQTQAKLSGLTQNRNNQTPVENTKSAIQSSPNKAQNALDAFSTGYKPKLQNQRSASGGGDGFSSVSESLDVKVGTLTALNTDQYLFYSFFNRVGELVYLRWATRVQNAQERVAARLINATNDRWTSMIDIWVKPNGEFHSAHLLKSSGVREFDLAASGAFQEAGLFPNPPRELIEEDGFIHLKYNLTVFFDPRGMVRH